MTDPTLTLNNRLPITANPAGVETSTPSESILYNETAQLYKQSLSPEEVKDARANLASFLKLLVKIDRRVKSGRT